MGSQLKLEAIKLKTGNAQAANNQKLFDETCECIDKDITTAAGYGFRTAQFRLAEVHTPIISKLIAEYSKFKCELHEYISKSPMDIEDYDFKYLKFDW